MGKKPEILAKFREMPLQEGSLTCRTLIEEIRDTTTLVIYPIKRFTHMIEEMEYFIQTNLPDGDWHFSMLKSEDQFQIVLCVQRFNANVLIGLHRNDGRIEPGIWDGTIIENEKTFHFGNKDILDPKNKLLNNGNLVVEFMYSPLPQEANILIIPGLQMNSHDLMINSDADLLCNDLRDLYFSSKNHDFEIVMREMEFKVHKIVICARSNYFERLLRLTPETEYVFVDFDIDTSLMHEVLLYMYSGKLNLLSAKHMCEVLEASCHMEIPCAIRICIHFLKNNLSVYILHYLVSVMESFRIRELGNDVINFLNEQPKRILGNPSFTDSFHDILEMLGCMGFRCHPSVYNAVRHE